MVLGEKDASVGTSGLVKKGKYWLTSQKDFFGDLIQWYSGITYSRLGCQVGCQGLNPDLICARQVLSLLSSLSSLKGY